MSKTTIGKKLTTSTKSSVPLKTNKAASSKENELNKKIVPTKLRTSENMTKPVIKSRTTQAIQNPSVPSIKSTNLTKLKPKVNGAPTSVNSPRNKTIPMRATVPMAPTKSNTFVKKTVPSSSTSVKKEILKPKILSSTPATLVKSKVLAHPPSAKSHSIMTPIHNVTVSSPPPQRREIVHEPVIEEQIDDDPITPIIRERTRTRTLEPHEVLLLQKNVIQTIINKPAEDSGATQPDSLEPDAGNSESSQPSEATETVKVKSPVSFEIKFEESKKNSSPPPPPSSLKLTPIEEPAVVEKKSSDSEEYDYEDDFESYASDFESERSTSLTTSDNSQNSENDDDNDDDEDNSATYTKSGTSMDNTYKVVDDRKLDSGNYEIDMRGESGSMVDVKPRPLEGLDSVFEENDESNTNNDSGLGYFETIRTTYPQPKNTSKTPKPRNTRGHELMQKIHLDEMQFSLFELKPMSYEYYMKIYGNNNAGQNSTQTHDDLMHQETQTDLKCMKTVWTQNPPCLTQSSLVNYHSTSYYYDKLGVGCDSDDDQYNNKHNNFVRRQIQTEMSIDKYNRLNELLQNSLVTISDIIYRKSKKGLKQTALTISNGYRPINSIAIVKLFSHNSFVFTIQKLEDRNLIYVWNLYSLESPYRILSCWSNVECIIMVNDCVVMCGLCNGSISIWDLREPFYWHTEILDGCNVRIASQIILPEIDNRHSEGRRTKDHGRVVDLKLMENGEQLDLLSCSNTIQLCSLHEYGLVTIWMFLEQKHSAFETNLAISKTTNYLNNLSPWSKVNLIQNSILNLDTYFLATEQNPNLSRNKTTFHKTIEYFDNNIFDDKILQQLNDTSNDSAAKKSDTINVKYNRIAFISKYGYFVNLSQNYMLFVKKSLKVTDIRKIFIDPNHLIRMIDFQIVAQNRLFIGVLSDGSCKVLSILNYLDQFFAQNIDGEAECGAANSNQPSGSQTTSSITHALNNDMLVPSKSCTIQNMIKDERQIYSTEMALNHFDQPEIKIMAKTGDGTSVNTIHVADRVIKRIKLINNNDLKFLLISNDKFVLTNFYLFKFNENLLLSLSNNILYLYNIEKDTQKVLISSVKQFTVIENLTGKNYLILLVGSSSTSDDVIEIHELNEKILHF